MRGRLVAWAVAGLAALQVACLPARAQTGEASARRTVALMGTFANVEVWADDAPRARSAAEAVVREIGRVEALLSTWREDSELSLLNDAPVGEAVGLSDELRRILEEAFGWARETGGAFHPAVGALVDAWDLRGAGRAPGPEEVRAALEATGPVGFVFDADAGTVTRTHEAAWMDAGAFGKGAALRSAADTLGARGIRRARLDLGGQLLLMGTEPVTVGVAHPRRRGEVAATLHVTRGSLATSGQSERFVEVEGRRFGHIIDPRTGQPVEAWGSVTVMGRDALVVDILATALFVLGPRSGMAVAERLDEVGVLFLEDTDGGLEASFNTAMEPFLGDVPRSAEGAAARRGASPPAPHHP